MDDKDNDNNDVVDTNSIFYRVYSTTTKYLDTTHIFWEVDAWVEDRVVDDLVDYYSMVDLHNHRDDPHYHHRGIQRDYYRYYPKVVLLYEERALYYHQYYNLATVRMNIIPSTVG